MRLEAHRSSQVAVHVSAIGAKAKQMCSAIQSSLSGVQILERGNLDHQSFSPETLIGAPVHATRTGREGRVDRHIAAQASADVLSLDDPPKQIRLALRGRPRRG